MRCGGLDMRAVNGTKQIKIASPSSLSAWLGVTKGDEMRILDTFVGETRSQFGL